MIQDLHNDVAPSDFKARLHAVHITAVLVGTGFLLFLALFEKDESTYIYMLMFAVAFGCSLFLFLRERSIVHALMPATGAVIYFQRTRSSDGGYDYRVRYRFRTQNGATYEGDSGTTMKELPTEGEAIEILYSRENPSENRPLTIFWFYRFSWTA